MGEGPVKAHLARHPRPDFARSFGQHSSSGDPMQPRLLALALCFSFAISCTSDPDPSANADADTATGATDTDGDAPADTVLGDTVLGDTAPDSDASTDSHTPTDADASLDADAGRPPRMLDPRPEWIDPPACGGAASWAGLIPGPNDEGFDVELAAKSRRIERQFHAFNAYGTGLNADAGVGGDGVEARELIREFLLETDSWDFEDWSGDPPTSVIGSWHKVAGAYGGVGIAADAFRYATLVREAAACDEIVRARVHVTQAMDGLHLAQAITGERGVIARGFANQLTPGSNEETTPLFDEEGNPLPEEKTNGTWRADNSGLYPDYAWEDSASRDQLIGWVIGMGALWEVIRDDPTFDQSLKDRLQADALAIAESMMTVQESGYDLEVRDADGRMTYHGVLHEESVDRVYVPGVRNGFNALMALGIMGTLSYVSEDADVEAYVYDQLIDERAFLSLINNDLVGVDLGHASNFSAYNMAFQGGWLSMRYLRDPVARAEARRAVRDSLYDRGGNHQPAEMKQTFYDLMHVIAVSGASAFGLPLEAPDEEALARGMETLEEWADAPYYDRPAENCDADEIAARECTAIDGSEIEVLGTLGRNDDLVAADPIPMRIRGSSNYWWRSNPYKIDQGAGGGNLLPGSDYRWTYWMARWVRRVE